MRDGVNFVRGLYQTVDPDESCEPRQPSAEDIWQAALLLIGVYGRDAVDYAVQRRNQLDGHGDRAGAATWALILAQIEDQLRGSPLCAVN